MWCAVFLIHARAHGQDKLQWDAAAGQYAAASDNCTANVGCAVQVGTFSDAFYAQVLAYTLGLGELLADPTKLTQHLATVGTRNCKHVVNGSVVDGCPNGLMIITGTVILSSVCSKLCG